MRQRDVHGRDAQCISSFRGWTVESKRRSAIQLRVDNLYVLPMDVPGFLRTSQRLVSGLLRGKSGSEMSGGLCATIAVRSLACREESQASAGWMSAEQACNAGNVGKVESDAANHVLPGPLRRRTLRQNEPLAPRESASAGSERVQTSSAARNARWTVSVQRRQVSN